MRFPPDLTEITDGLQPLDPARDSLLEFFKAAINAELGAAWTAALGVSVIPDLGATPVTDCYPALPSPELMRQRKAAWPALFLGRDHEDSRNAIRERTIWQDELVQIWGLHYVMPALDVIHRRKFEDIALNVVALCNQCVRHMHHPAYQAGAYFMPSIGLSTIRVVSMRGGNASFAGGEGGPTYFAMSMVLETTELTGHIVGNEAPFTDFTLRAGTGNVEGIIPITVEAYSDVP
jgi:hypothetical protein